MARGLLLGHYPPRYTLFEQDVLTTIVSALNYRGIRYVPVVSHEGAYRGVLRIGRVLEAIVKARREGDLEKTLVLKAVEAADGSVPALSYPPEGVGEVLRVMEEHRVGGVAVVLEGRVVGEVTDKMLVDLLVGGRELGRSVDELATRRPLTIEANEPLERALELMVEKGVRRLPVTYQGELVGMLSARDVFRYLAQSIAEGQGLTSEALEAQVWYVASPRPIVIEEGLDASKAVEVLRREGVGSLIVVAEDRSVTGVLTERDLLLRLPRGLVVELAESRLPRLDA